MLYGELYAAGPVARAAYFDERGAALEKADNIASFRNEWQKFAKTPDAALIFDGAA